MLITSGMFVVTDIESEEAVDISSAGSSVKLNLANTIRFVLYDSLRYCAKAKEIIYELVTLKGAVYN